MMRYMIASPAHRRRISDLWCSGIVALRERRGGDREVVATAESGFQEGKSLARLLTSVDRTVRAFGSGTTTVTAIGATLRTPHALRFEETFVIVTDGLAKGQLCGGSERVGESRLVRAIIEALRITPSHPARIVPERLRHIGATFEDDYSIVSVQR